MKHYHFFVASILAGLSTYWFLNDSPDLQTAKIVALVFLAFFGGGAGILWLALLAADAITVFATFFEADRREFTEPETETLFESDELGPVLVECDTCGKPAAPDEVMIHRYLWNPAISAYDYAGCVALSQYALLDSTPPTIWDHAKVFPGPGRDNLTNHGASLNGHPSYFHDSEFDEIERSLIALEVRVPPFTKVTDLTLAQLNQVNRAMLDETGCILAYPADRPDLTGLCCGDGPISLLLDPDTTVNDAWAKAYQRKALASQASPLPAAGDTF